MQKTVEFYHSKGIDILKLECTLPNMANVGLHGCTKAKFYPLTKNDNDLPPKVQEDVVGGPSVVCTCKTLVPKINIHKSTEVYDSFTGIDASQLNVSTYA